MKIKIVNKSSNPTPQYKTLLSAGADIQSNTDAFVIKPMERVLVPTGIFIQIPKGYEGQVRARSGLSIKKGLTLVNGIGTIDADYTGEIKIPLINLSEENHVVMRGDRIAQLIIAKIEQAEWHEVETIEETERGEGGFGSTGV